MCKIVTTEESLCVGKNTLRQHGFLVIISSETAD